MSPPPQKKINCDRIEVFSQTVLLKTHRRYFDDVVKVAHITPVQRLNQQNSIFMVANSAQRDSSAYESIGDKIMPPNSSKNVQLTLFTEKTIRRLYIIGGTAPQKERNLSAAP